MGNHVGADNRQDAGDVSTISVSVSHNTEDLLVHVAQAATELPF
jgi:hypothetical protein